MRPPLRWLLLLLAVGLPLVPGRPGAVGARPALAQETANQDQQAEADRLFEQGIRQYGVEQFREALQSWQAALEIYRATGDRAREAATLNNIGYVNQLLENYPAALDFYEQRLIIIRELGNREGEAEALNIIGTLNQLSENYPAALDSYEQSLAISRELGDRAGEAKILNNIGNVNRLLENYPGALEYYEQSLVISHELGNRADEASTLRNIGRMNIALENYPRALDYFEQSLVITREIGDRVREAETLNNIGDANKLLVNYPAALDYYEQRLAITRKIGDRTGEAETLNDIGAVNTLLGNYPRALDYYEQGLVITREIGDRAGEAAILTSIGAWNQLLENYPRALEYYGQSLAISRELENRANEARIRNNIGIINASLGNYPRALDYFEQSLVISRELSESPFESAFEAQILNNIGRVNQDLENYPAALDYYEQSLLITRQISDRAGEAQTLGNIGFLFKAQEEFELAIVFLKQAINTYEAIRQSNQALEQSLQESYTATIESNYRRLADLLLQQDRILEAQRVLDLLRVQELDTYLRGVRGNGDTQAGIAPRPDEQAIVDRYTANEAQLIELGRERAELAKIAPDQRTPQQQARIAELHQLEQAVLLTFQSFFEQADIVALVARLRSTLGAANIELPELNGLRDNLQRLNQNAVVLYPLVLDDRLELVLVTPGQAPIRRTVPVTRVELNRAIGELRYALESPTRNAVTPAQQLYTWLIRPIEADLQQAQAKTIIYSPDLRLRYVPLAALHDGENWLIESYSVNNITAASLADLNHIPSRGEPSVLAAAFTEGRYEFQEGNRTVAYNGLPQAGPEIEALARLIPATTARLNQAFNPSLVFEMDDYRIIHLATHAAFNPGGLENSYILFGNGEKATLADVKGWSFPNVDLVVLSACETAVGDVLRAEETLAAGTQSGSINGEEILGFGYLMQLAGADAAIGSLWKVDDGGTQILMSAFYDALSRGGLAKAAALQQAQLDLIRISEGENRGGFELAQELGLDPNNLAHPHYWAPFILIGNGL